ncbi:hypothetical protein NVP1244A_148 [Vibrio phage 1.244.A._10N.261.54.C3]|nr:hypothetical protein NVP1244A_148 [Vibrio phage 1.244.A._10N.261.54.C3]AUR98776.1 hypothetical protein NVP1255O_148 [Vibrio phage 1.255.O._10N.286.45.F1]
MMIEPIKVVVNIGGVQKWQNELDKICSAQATKADVFQPAVGILYEECQRRFMGMAHTEMFKHTVHEFFKVFNLHIKAAGVHGWGGNELKFMVCGKKHSLTIIHHHYTYKFNIFKREVDFYDNGVKFYTYRSEWVQKNIGDEPSFCVYAMRWMAREGVSRCLIDEGYPFSGILGAYKPLDDFVTQ